MSILERGNVINECLNKIRGKRVLCPKVAVMVGKVRNTDIVFKGDVSLTLSRTMVSITKV